MSRPQVIATKYCLVDCLTKNIIELHSNFIIGRVEGNFVIEEDDKLSKKHCKITIVNDQVFIQDLNSTNKTFVNSDKLKEKPQELSQGDIIVVGNQKYIFSEAKKVVELNLVTVKTISKKSKARPTSKQKDTSDVSSKTNEYIDSIKDHVAETTKKLEPSLKKFLLSYFILSLIIVGYLSYIEFISSISSGVFSYLLFNITLFYAVFVGLSYGFRYVEPFVLNMKKFSGENKKKKFITRGLLSVLIPLFYFILSSIFLSSHPYKLGSSTDKLGQLCLSKDMKSCHKLALILWDRGNKIEALEKLRATCYERYHKACYTASYLRIRNREFNNGSKTLNLAKKALKYKPNSIEYMDNLALAYANWRMFDNAIDVTVKALALEPGSNLKKTLNQRLEMYNKEKSLIDQMEEND